MIGGGGGLYVAPSAGGMTSGDWLMFGMLIGALLGALITGFIMSSGKRDEGGGWWRRRRDRDAPIRPAPTGGGGDTPPTSQPTDLADQVERWLREVTDERKTERERIGSG